MNKPYLLLIFLFLSLKAFPQNGLYFGLEANFHYGLFQVDDPGNYIDIRHDQYNRIQFSPGLRLGGNISENLIWEVGYVKFISYRYSAFNEVSFITTGYASRDIPFRIMGNISFNNFSWKPYIGIRGHFKGPSNQSSNTTLTNYMHSRQDSATISYYQESLPGISFSLEFGSRLTYSGPKKRLEYNLSIFYMQGLAKFSESSIQYYFHAQPEHTYRARVWSYASGVNLSLGINYNLTRQAKLNNPSKPDF
ncbi:MAG: hypothetical protein ACK4ND_00150 [Cytophagaceae bacterium]